MSDAPITLLIALSTGLVSYQAWKQGEWMRKLLLSPWRVKHYREYYRLLSHTLVHADTFHLIFNLFAFWSFGTFMEQVFREEEMFMALFPRIPFWGRNAGFLLYVVLYVGGALVATLPAMRKYAEVPSYQAVGASGAVSAVMMAFMLLFPNFEVLFFFILPCPAWLGALIFFATEHWLSRRGDTRIAHDAHIWGALFGLALMSAIRPQFLVSFFHSVAASLGF